MRSIVINELIWGFHRIYTNLEPYFDALKAAHSYRTILVDCQGKALDDAERKFMSELEALWSLSSLCLLQAPQIEPVEFVHQLLRWCQHHSVDESRWIEVLSQKGFTIVPDEFWEAIVRLVAIRNFELACLLLRQLLLEGHNGEREAIEILLERMLQAPTPSAVMDDPGIFDHWIMENAQCFQDESIEFGAHVHDLAAILQGQVGSVRISLTWMERLLADLIYGQVPFDYEELGLHVATIDVSSKTVDQIYWKLLCFDSSAVSESLFAGCSMIEWMPLFVTHFAPLVQIPELLAGASFYVAKYTEWIGAQNADLLTLSASYALLINDDTLVTRIINGLDPDSLVSVSRKYPSARKLCRQALDRFAWKAFDDGNLQGAISLATDASNDLLQGIVAKTLLDHYSVSKDSCDLIVPISESSSYGAFFGALRVIHQASLDSSVSKDSLLDTVLVLLPMRWPYPASVAEMILEFLVQIIDPSKIDWERRSIILEFVNRYPASSTARVLREHLVHRLK